MNPQNHTDGTWNGNPGVTHSAIPQTPTVCQLGGLVLGSDRITSLLHGKQTPKQVLILNVGLGTGTIALFGELIYVLIHPTQRELVHTIDQALC